MDKSKDFIGDKENGSRVGYLEMPSLKGYRNPLSATGR